jgi:hypothetical protein
VNVSAAMGLQGVLKSNLGSINNNTPWYGFIDLK